MNKLFSTLRNGIIAVCTAGLLALTSPAQAVPILIVGGNGQLLGASGVDVGGTLYDVEFKNGSCVSLFGGCDSVGDFTFQTKFEAESAALALLATVFIDDTGLGQFDSVPALTLDISSTTRAQILIPYDIFGSAFAFTQAFNSNVELQDGIASSIAGIGNVLVPSDQAFARFTPAQVSVVPLPPAGVLFGSGLVFLALLRRRARKLEHA